MPDVSISYNLHLECGQLINLYDWLQVSSSVPVLSSMPDVCIVYKLHLECGQLINLYDWLQVSSSVPVL